MHRSSLGLLHEIYGEQKNCNCCNGYKWNSRREMPAYVSHVIFSRSKLCAVRGIYVLSLRIGTIVKWIQRLFVLIFFVLTRFCNDDFTLVFLEIDQ